jgi:hypothetical protein
MLFFFHYLFKDYLLENSEIKNKKRGRKKILILNNLRRMILFYLLCKERSITQQQSGRIGQMQKNQCLPKKFLFVAHSLSTSRVEYRIEKSFYHPSIALSLYFLTANITFILLLSRTFNTYKKWLLLRSTQQQNNECFCIKCFVVQKYEEKEEKNGGGKCEKKASN